MWPISAKTSIIQSLYGRIKPFIRNSRPEVFLRKGVLKIWRKFTGEHPWRSVTNLLYISEHLFLRTPLDGCFWFVLDIRLFRHSAYSDINATSAHKFKQAHPEASRTSKMKFFAQIVNAWKFLISIKSSILDFDLALNAALLYKEN